LDKLNFKPLQIPANYYADLAARLDLRDDDLQQMTQANILFDQDNDGEFLQLYSRPFAGGVFFWGR